MLLQRPVSRYGEREEPEEHDIEKMQQNEMEKQYLKENFDYVPSGDEIGWLDDEDEEMDTETMEALMADVESDSRDAHAEIRFSEEDLSSETTEETENED